MSREDLYSGDPSEVPPVGTIAGGDKGRVIVRCVLRRGEFGPIGEGDIVCSEYLIGYLRGGDEKNWTGSELEIKHGAMNGGEVGQSAVEGLLEEVEVAYDWSGRRTGWETTVFAFTGEDELDGEEEEEDKGEERERRVGERRRLHGDYRSRLPGV